MRWFNTALVMSAVLLHVGCGSSPTATTGGGPKPDGERTMPAGDAKELEQLKGTWHVIAIEAAGKPVPANRVQGLGLQYIIEGNKFTTHRPDRPDQTHTVTIDSAVSPKRLTVDQTPPMRAIYAVEGNRMRLCVMVDENPNAGYPTEMVSRASPNTDLLTLERRTESQPPPGNLP